MMDSRNKAATLAWFTHSVAGISVYLAALYSKRRGYCIVFVKKLKKQTNKQIFRQLFFNEEIYDLAPSSIPISFVQSFNGRM